MIKTIASEEVQQFIKAHELDDERVLVLKHKTVLGLPTALIAEQIRGRRKAKEKLPIFYDTPGVVYPPSVNLEQSSSEASAWFKLEIIKKSVGENRLRCADLTGGFGVDSFFFSKIFSEVHHIEPNLGLLKITQHNHERLGAKNISYHNTSAENFLGKYAVAFDLIYVDPSRRSKANKKVFRLADCEPNIAMFSDQLYAKTNHLLLKTSPLIDIQQGLLGLRNIKEVYIVSVDNECKEILFHGTSSFTNGPEIHAINILGDLYERFSFIRKDEQNAGALFSGPLDYLYEPNASILKAGAFKLIGQRFHLFKLHPSTHLYTSRELVNEFPGRIFKIIAHVKPEKKEIKKFFTTGKANVITRNFPLSAEELKKKSGLKDGGVEYLIGFTSKEKKMTVQVERIK